MEAMAAALAAATAEVAMVGAKVAVARMVAATAAARVAAVRVAEERTVETVACGEVRRVSVPCGGSKANVCRKQGSWFGCSKLQHGPRRRIKTVCQHWRRRRAPHVKHARAPRRGRHLQTARRFCDGMLGGGAPIAGPCAYARVDSGAAAEQCRRGTAGYVQVGQGRAGQRVRDKRTPFDLTPRAAGAKLIRYTRGGLHVSHASTRPFVCGGSTAQVLRTLMMLMGSPCLASAVSCATRRQRARTAVMDVHAVLRQHTAGLVPLRGVVTQTLLRIAHRTGVTQAPSRRRLKVPNESGDCGWLSTDSSMTRALSLSVSKFS